MIAHTEEIHRHQKERLAQMKIIADATVGKRAAKTAKISLTIKNFIILMMATQYIHQIRIFTFFI